MATFKLTSAVSHFYPKLVGGMVERGYPKDFTERTLKQIEGLGSNGFLESHAASFTKIAYASCWMKHHHPNLLCAALLNAQSMKGLGEAPFPLFAAADEREAKFSPEGLEPSVALRPMTDCREMVEDYRSTQLSLRGHPVRFLRQQLDAIKIVRRDDP